MARKLRDDLPRIDYVPSRTEIFEISPSRPPIAPCLPSSRSPAKTSHLRGGNSWGWHPHTQTTQSGLVPPRALPQVARHAGMCPQERGEKRKTQCIL